MPTTRVITRALREGKRNMARYRTQIQWGGPDAGWHDDSDLTIEISNRHAVVPGTGRPEGEIVDEVRRGHRPAGDRDPGLVGGPGGQRDDHLLRRRGAVPGRGPVPRRGPGRLPRPGNLIRDRPD